MRVGPGSDAERAAMNVYPLANARVGELLSDIAGCKPILAAA
jgi:hypothetical protein